MPTVPFIMVKVHCLEGFGQRIEATISPLRVLLGQAPLVAPSLPHTVQLLMQRPQHHCGLDAVPKSQRPEHT